VQSRTGFRGFATRPLGQIVLLVVAVLVVAAGAVYLGALLTIFLILLFGLALPIYLGLKIPRRLAVLGIVIYLLAGPVAAVLDAQQTLVPSPAAQSFGENGGNVFQNAQVHPYNGNGGQNYTFQLTVDPSYLYPNTTLVNLTLFVSTCPDSSRANDPTILACQTPYPSYEQVLATPNLTSTTTYSFHQKLPGPNVFWWIVWGTFVYASNHTACNTNCIFLNANNNYLCIEGPVTGSFGAIVGVVIVAVYLDLLLYPVIAFFAALAFYAWFKSRERRRKAEQAAARGPGGGPGAPAAGAAAGPGSGSTGPEMRCPKCSAVVYANESQCWKCGAPLGAAAGAAPLPSGPAPPPPPTGGASGPST
jgi:hypothetical protein